VTQLGIGTATFLSGYGLGPDTPSVDTAAGLLRDAFGEGIRYVDTAAVYGDAELVLGRVAQEIRDRAVRVCTKIKAGGERIVAEVRESRARMGIDRIDTLLLHSAHAEALVDPALAEDLHELGAQGLVSRIGASTYGIADARAALAQDWCAALQVEHSILNPSVVRTVSKEAARAEIIVRSVLCKGLLTGRRSHAPRVAQELAMTLDRLERLAAEWGWSMPELAIRYALDTPGVDVVLVGISSQGELKTALAAAARTPLDAASRAELANFDRSDSNATHPERWALFGS
jgi:aryl-alcohol dehydrogenase-like predicted oxidoreductase